MKKYLAFVLTVSFSLTSIAGTIIDTYRFTNIESADEVLEVSNVDNDSLQIRIVSKNGNVRGTPIIATRDQLHMAAIQESFESLKIFDTQISGVRSSKLDVGATYIRSILLIPILAVLFPPAGAVAAGVGLAVGMGVADLKNPTLSLEKDPVLLSGSANLVLMAESKEGVQASRFDRSNVYVSITNNLSTILAHQSEKEAQLLSELPIKSVTEVSGVELREMAASFQKLSAAATSKHAEVEKLPLSNFEKDTGLKLVDSQKAIAQSALSQTKNLIAVMQNGQMSSQEVIRAQKTFDHLRILLDYRKF